MTTVAGSRPAEFGHGLESELGHELGLGLRERKKQQTRHAIHQAAYQLIDEQGLESTTIDQICQLAEVSSRTFFNYFPSKAAAALQLPEETITADARERFRSARGGLVWALCDVVGSSSEFAPDHAKLKALITRHPELIATMSGMMLELRGSFLDLAAERAESREQAELAVALVMAALGRTMHEADDRDLPLVDRLRTTVTQLGGVLQADMVAPAAS